MTEAFDRVMAGQGDALRRKLKKLTEAVEEAYDPENSETYQDSLFAQMVIEKLLDQMVLALPSQMDDDHEYFQEHRFKAEIRRAQVNVWGSALLKNGEDGYALHVFAVDYDDSTEPEELEKTAFDQMCRGATNFYQRVADGSLLKAVAHEHKVWKYARRIADAKDQIILVRYWLLTSRVCLLTKAGRANSSTGPEQTMQVVDLQELVRMDAERGGIDQDFRGIGGIPCQETAGSEASYRCLQTYFHGTTLSQLYSIHSTALIEANVRAYLGENKVNSEIRSTIENNPENFLAFNNGLVISAEKAEVELGRLMKLEGVQIINGGQTTASIYQTWLAARNNRRNPERAEEIKKNLEIVRVSAKIVVPRKELADDLLAWNEFRAGISKAANSQTAVKISDLSANSQFQINLARVINGLLTPEGDYWVYERARGLYKAELAQHKGDRGGRFAKEHPKHKVVTKTELALAVMCWRGKAQIAAMGQERAFGEFQKQMEPPRDSGRTPQAVDKDFAIQCICQWILFSSLEKEMKRERRLDKEVSNPRVPVIYAIALFAKEYGKRMHWDRMWSHQAVSPSLMNELKRFTKEVNRIMRRQMGNMMIAMWGRKAQCMTMLQSELDFDKFDFESTYEISH